MTLSGLHRSATAKPLGNKGLQNRANQRFMKRMSRTGSTTTTTQRVVAHRERRRASGHVLVNVDLPGDLVEAIDRLKEAHGVRSRAPIIEEALRFYIEKQQGA
ncbi:ribbon-helix-helix domain-containing protein [Agrobacterium sp. MAFF210268]|nr:MULTISPECIES: ribbon-helix-helix domain-containing protein [Agrobacterium]MDA5250271.1 ribbon-helix-helix domain-containing protein [Agrobacterium sp. MAFF210268]